VIQLAGLCCRIPKGSFGCGAVPFKGNSNAFIEKGTQLDANVICPAAVNPDGPPKTVSVPLMSSEIRD